MQTEPLNTVDPLDWIAILRAEVAKDGKSVSSVAREIHMPRPSLSMLLNDTYPAGLDKVNGKFRKKVLGLYRAQLHCPHLNEGISQKDCKHHASRPNSSGNPIRIRQHNACRVCPQNPIQTAENGIKT